MTQLFDPETGEVGEPDGCPKCRQALEERLMAEQDLRAAEKELRRLRRVNGNLVSELERQRSESSEGRLAHALGRYWITRLEKDPKRTKLGEKRLKAVIARIREGREPSYICRAIDGLAEHAWVNPETGQRYDDLELVCRDEVHLERYHDIAERMGAKTLLGPAWFKEFDTPKSDDQQKDDF